MNKQQLIEYLDAVCDAESAVQACNDAIEGYQNQRSSLHHPSTPQSPNLVSAEPTQTSFTWGIEDIGCSAVLFLPIFYVTIGFLMLLGITDGISHDSTTHGTIIFAIIAAFIGLPVIMWVIHQRELTSTQEEAEEKAKAWNNTQKQQYHIASCIYDKQLILYNAAIVSFDNAIASQKTVCQTVQKKLRKLYSQNILYPSFQNLIAAYQIREYLKMGICDTLEGPTGAYAQYMNDVRTARVCDSITDLKRTLTTAIHGLQGTLARELQQIDSNLTDIRGEMSTSINRLTNQMQQMQNASSAQLDAHFSEANRQLRTLNENVAVAEHNRYIERRLQNVDTYLMKLPKSS